jgi:MFS family permease
MHHSHTESGPRHARLGPIRLAEGVELRHVCAYLFATFVSIGLFTYLATLTPYLLEVNLGVPGNQHGTVTGRLQFWQEVLMLGVIGLWGALSDRIGRRPVYVAGFVLLALAYATYPTATSIDELTAYRLIFGLAIAALTAMIITVAADYAAEDSRGKLTGFTFLLNGIGAVLFFGVLSKLPQWLIAGGYTPEAAGRLAYWLIAALALLAGIVMLGLKPGRPAAVREKTPIPVILKQGVLAARNPRIALAYGGAFAARADMAIISLFLSLWAVQAGTAQGATPDEALARSGIVVATALSASMVWSLVIGFIADRIDRLTLLGIGFLLAAAGYGWVASLADPLAAAAIPALILLGIGQSSTVLSSTVLLAQECPPEIRGAVFGLQSFCGAVGILLLSVGGGVLFDTVGPYAPILVVAAANGVVGVLGLLLSAQERRLGSTAVALGRSAE